MTNEKAIMCLEDMKIKVPIPKAAKQARENNEALDVAIKTLKSEPHWIPVTERLPEEEDSIFARYYGTDRWRKAMFRKKSREVIVTSVLRMENCIQRSHTQRTASGMSVLMSFRERSSHGCHSPNLTRG